jgi:hypothetical protein
MPRAPLTLVCLMLALQPAPAQTLATGTVAPGKPAGAQAAQHFSQRNLFIAGSLIAVALALALPSSSATSTATTVTNSTTS